MFCREFESPDRRRDLQPWKRDAPRADPAFAVDGRGKVAALVTVVLVAGDLFWAMRAVMRHNAVQNCIDSGRRDCRDPTKP